MSDLIERLRGPCPSIPAMRDAADEIERLTAERDELRRQIDECSQMLARQAATIRDLTRPAGPRG